MSKKDIILISFDAPKASGKTLLMKHVISNLEELGFMVEVKDETHQMAVSHDTKSIVQACLDFDANIN